MSLAVSVLMPSYNYGRYISAAIESVARQAVSEIELVVQDAGSTDQTKDVIDKLEPGFLSFVSEPDLGQSDALNRALQRSRGDIIGWLNADEFYLPHAIPRVLECFVRNPNLDVLYGDCVFVDEGGRFLRLLPSHEPSEFTLRNYGCYISSCTVFVRRSMLLGEAWDRRLRRAMDWDLWLRLFRIARVGYMRRPLAAFRIHGAQITSVPESQDWPEFEGIRRAHGISSSTAMRALGRAEHIRRKVLEGQYLRQMRANLLFGGRDVSWHGGRSSTAAEELTRA